MPQITVEGESAFEVESGKKLVLCLEDNGIDILHRCGGMARCTTCRVEILSGDVPPLSEIEIEGDDDTTLLRRLRENVAIWKTLKLLVSQMCGLVALLTIWVIGQDFGQLYTGQATDPNTALIATVVAAGLLAGYCRRPREDADRLRRRT